METVTIKNIQSKTTGTGTLMWIVSTSIGNMNTFNKAIADQLFTLINQNVDVEYKVNNNFKNLIKVKVTENQAPIGIPTGTKTPFDPVTCLLAYMKDLVVAQIENAPKLPLPIIPVNDGTTNKNTEIEKYWVQAHKNVMEYYEAIKNDLLAMDMREKQKKFEQDLNNEENFEY